ncbi:hypothetical protein UPYG_G00002710 [Umbra pygmaea]|uniref:Uncharacterized protein n=1 Tax=Umbra pygmaea TaxID=75934 RepID=A0ABD0XGP5_UMBPY
MTSVNSPACLLARNHFYRNPNPVERRKPSTVYNVSDWSTLQPKQKQVTVWVSMTTESGFPGRMTTEWCVSLVIGNAAPRTTPVKCPSPANPGVK